MNCQTFSTGFSSGERGGSGTNVMLSGVNERLKLTRFQQLKVVHPWGSKAARRAAFI
jgi:hypothetical protein